MMDTIRLRKELEPMFRKYASEKTGLMGKGELYKFMKEV